MPLDASSGESLDQLSSGDQVAFARLFSQNRGRLKQMLAHRIDPRLKVRVDLSDILQEAYIEAFKRVEHFLANREQSFYIWLRQITLQRLIDVHRQHVHAEKRSLRSEVPLRHAGHRSADSHSWAIQIVSKQVSPSQVAIHHEMVARVERTLECLDPMDREVLVLRHFEELRNGEVAEVLGVSAAAASNRYVRALKRLREALVTDSDVSNN